MVMGLLGNACANATVLPPASAAAVASLSACPVNWRLCMVSTRWGWVNMTVRSGVQVVRRHAAMRSKTVAVATPVAPASAATP